MTIHIVQTCDGCGDSRNIEDITKSENQGWRLVKTDAHLCLSCINRAIESPKAKPSPWTKMEWK